jgi:hypothetical protein
VITGKDTMMTISIEQKDNLWHVMVNGESKYSHALKDFARAVAVNRFGYQVHALPTNQTKKILARLHNA